MANLLQCLSFSLFYTTLTHKRKANAKYKTFLYVRRAERSKQFFFSSVDKTVKFVALDRVNEGTSYCLERQFNTKKKRRKKNPISMSLWSNECTLYILALYINVAVLYSMQHVFAARARASERAWICLSYNCFQVWCANTFYVHINLCTNTHTHATMWSVITMHSRIKNRCN